MASGPRRVWALWGAFACLAASGRDAQAAVFVSLVVRGSLIIIIVVIPVDIHRTEAAGDFIQRFVFQSLGFLVLNSCFFPFLLHGSGLLYKMRRKPLPVRMRARRRVCLPEKTSFHKNILSQVLSQNNRCSVASTRPRTGPDDCSVPRPRCFKDVQNPAACLSRRFLPGRAL